MTERCLIVTHYPDTPTCTSNIYGPCRARTSPLAPGAPLGTGWRRALSALLDAPQSGGCGGGGASESDAPSVSLAGMSLAGRSGRGAGAQHTPAGGGSSLTRACGSQVSA